MKSWGKGAGMFLVRLGGVLAVAALVWRLLLSLGLDPWLRAFLVFALSKVLVDGIAALIKRKERNYVFFEDYLRETLLFLAVAAVCVLVMAVVENYLQGTVWPPVPAAVAILVWR